MVHDTRAPGYLARTPNLDKPGAYPTPGTGQDVFAYEPGEGAVPLMDPTCNPRPVTAVGEVQIPAAGVRTLIAQLEWPWDAEYTHLDVQWFTDYDLIYRQGFLLVELEHALGSVGPIAVPIEQSEPLRIPRCFDKGELISVFATVAVPVPLGNANLATPIYVGANLGVGLAKPQRIERHFARRQPEGEQRIEVVVGPGAAIANVVVVPIYIATRVKVIWPGLLGGPPAPGSIQVTTNLASGAFGAPVTLTQATTFPPIVSGEEFFIGDLREFAIGDPLGTLGAPALVTLIWDRWRQR